ncbi:hypothetical protein HOG48_03540 [Candidatus Peregrinibacteria bacterium]|jgi:hypothetical protein|nr:hypothetical protein [Candidatus Peregrinibacteria bacterium]
MRTLSIHDVCKVAKPLIEIIEVDLPNSWEDHLTSEFEGIELHTARDLGELAATVKKRILTLALTDDLLMQQYLFIFHRARNDARLALALELDLEEMCEKEIAGFDYSARTGFLEFLKTRNGEWASGDLKNWPHPKYSGEVIRHRICSLIGEMTPESILIVAGPEGAELLKRNPFIIKRSKMIRCEMEGIVQLAGFLKSLKKGQTWASEDLKEYPGNKIDGGKIRKWFTRNIGFIKSRVDAFLMKYGYEKYITRNPFRGRILRDPKMVKKYLEEFIRSTPNNGWSISNLLAWTSKDGLAIGRTLYSYLEWTSESGIIRTLKKYGIDIELLETYPFFPKNDHHPR